MATADGVAKKIEDLRRKYKFGCTDEERLPRTKVVEKEKDADKRSSKVNWEKEQALWIGSLQSSAPGPDSSSGEPSAARKSKKKKAGKKSKKSKPDFHVAAKNCPIPNIFEVEQKKKLHAKSNHKARTQSAPAPESPFLETIKHLPPMLPLPPLTPKDRKVLRVESDRNAMVGRLLEMQSGNRSMYLSNRATLARINKKESENVNLDQDTAVWKRKFGAQQAKMSDVLKKREELTRTTTKLGEQPPALRDENRLLKVELEKEERNYKALKEKAKLTQQKGEGKGDGSLVQEMRSIIDAECKTKNTIADVSLQIGSIDGLLSQLKTDVARKIVRLSDVHKLNHEAIACGMDGAGDLIPPSGYGPIQERELNIDNVRAKKVLRQKKVHEAEKKFADITRPSKPKKKEKGATDLKLLKNEEDTAGNQEFEDDQSD